MENSGLISVIIPVYNVEQYLERCVTSVLSQTYRNLDIILVDDGSPDRSGEMCDQLAAGDSRIRVFHKKNGGLSSARNYGLDNAKGQYVSFIDSDDYINLCYFEKMMVALRGSGADIAVCAINSVSTNDIKEVDEDYCIGQLLSGKEAVNLMLKSEVWCSAWGKLYSINCIENLRFIEGRIHEDFPYLFHAFLGANKVIYNSQAIYYYYIGSQGITKNVSIGKRFDVFLNTKEIWEECIAEYPELEEAAYWQYLRHGIVNRVFDICNYNQSSLYPKECKTIMSAYKEHRSKIFLITDFKERLLLLLIQYSPAFYVWLRRMKSKC